MKQKIQKLSEKFLKKSRIMKYKRTKRKYKSLEIKTHKKSDLTQASISSPIKVRNPGIDLGRIISMYGIIIHHILLWGRGASHFHQYKELRYLDIVINWHVNDFIFISGYVGYKTTKYSNLFYLWLCTLFYSLGIIKYFSIYKPNLYKKQIYFNDFFPVINIQYWYFTAYFGMYLFLPVINKGLESINKSQLKIAILSFIIIFSILQDYINPKLDSFQIVNGYSVLWFIILYITGAYFGKFKKDSNYIKKIMKSIIYILIFYYSGYLCINLPDYRINYINNNKKQILKTKFILFLKSIFKARFSSITMILQSISSILFLTNINYNKYIAKIISFIGPLTFGVYLIHDNSVVRGVIMRDLLKNYPRRLPLNTVYKIIFSKGLKIFGICLIIDYLRNILFRILQVRKICILFEKLIFILFR